MFELPAAIPVAIGTLDALIVVFYLAATTLLGIWLGRGQKNNRDYFLAGHKLPTWSLLLSIVATETSTVTFLSVPGKSYVENGNFTFLQIAFGYIVGRFAIIVFLLPAYFRGEMLSAYHVMESRFGLTTRRLASLVFLVTRNLADGLRLYLSAVALDIALGGGLITSIVVMTIITAIYSCAGGVKSVVWNDCIQFAVYMAGAIATVWIIVTHLPAGWSQLAEFGQATDRWQLFDFDPSLTKPKRHVLVRAIRRRVSVTRNTWRRSNDRAALLVRSRSKVSKLGVGTKRLCRTCAIRVVPFNWCRARLFLFVTERSGCGPSGRRQGLHDVRRQAHGNRFSRIDFGGSLGRDHVESFGIVQFIGQLADE